MKVNTLHHNYKSFRRTTMILFAVMLCFVSSAQDEYIDSLKLELKRANTNEVRCETNFEIFRYYDSIELVDSMNHYAGGVLSSCEFFKAEGGYISYVIEYQYRKGLSGSITPFVDNLVTKTEDPDSRLELLVFLGQTCMFYGGEEQFKKYWSQAEETLKYVKTGYAKFLYYSFLGVKNRNDGNLFAALQSIQLASTFGGEDGVEGELYLFNELELAYVYHAIGDYEKAIAVCLKLKGEVGGVWNKINTYIHYVLIDCHYRLGNYNAVIREARTSIYSVKLNGYESALGYAYTMLGDAYLKLLQMPPDTTFNESLNSDFKNTVAPNYADSVLHYTRLGIRQSLNNSETEQLVNSYYTLYNYYSEIEDYDKAESYLIAIQEEGTQFYEEEVLDQEFAQLWSNKNNYEKAFFHLNRYMESQAEKTDNKSEDVSLVIDILEESYASKQKEQRLREIMFLTVGGLVLLGLFLIYVQRNRNKLKLLNDKIQERNKELSILNTKQKETIKYLDNFASVAAHDLKAPITTSIGFAETLAVKAKDKLGESEKKYLNHIISSVFRLSKMIDNLLALSRLDVNLPEATQVDLNEVITQVERVLFDVVNKDGSKIVVESSLPKISGHSTLISQLFQNLIKNAIVHNKTGDSTVVKISSEHKEDGMYVIKASDNSGGIPEDLVPTMFDLFSNSSKSTGNGIGLATCKKIVNHYGGEIWVEVKPGVGSTFSFNLFDQSF